ncbi:MAG: hypothetical protein MZU95_08160 [Desulfomicrobium escambiense]|nr:hypothetical protein [Desulfomicrobium escambiense]
MKETDPKVLKFLVRALLPQATVSIGMAQVVLREESLPRRMARHALHGRADRRRPLPVRRSVLLPEGAFGRPRDRSEADVLQRPSRRARRRSRTPRRRKNDASMSVVFPLSRPFQFGLQDLLVFRNRIISALEQRIAS